MLSLQPKEILFLQNRVAYVRDEQAYKQLFFHYHQRLHRFAMGVIKDNETAEEIVSDVMMKVWDAGNKLAQVEKLDAYLYTAVKNACLTGINKKKSNILSLDEVPEDSAISFTTPCDELEHSEISHKIAACINSLPPQCVMVYKLVKEEGFSYKKVAAILEISQNSIETHMRIALKRIRQALHNYLQEKK